MATIIRKTNSITNEIKIACGICRKLRVINPFEIVRVFVTVNAFVH